MNDRFKSIWLYINLTLYGFNKFIFLLGLFDTYVTCRAYPNFKTMIKINMHCHWKIKHDKDEIKFKVWPTCQSSFSTLRI